MILIVLLSILFFISFYSLFCILATPDTISSNEQINYENNDDNYNNKNDAPSETTTTNSGDVKQTDEIKSNVDYQPPPDIIPNSSSNLTTNEIDLVSLKMINKSVDDDDGGVGDGEETVSIAGLEVVDTISTNSGING